jgi:hypothetical protein
MVAGMAPVFVGAGLYFRFDLHATALLVLSGAGLYGVVEYAQRGVQRAEERRALADLARMHAT